MDKKLNLITFHLLIFSSTSSSFPSGHPPELRQCGPGPKQVYHPKWQSCCEDTVCDIPEEQCQCCGNKGYWKNQTKPSTCMKQCGKNKTPYYPGTEMCCDGKVFTWSANTQVCCGQRVMDQNTHKCCGRDKAWQFPIERNSEYGCCQDLTPYHKDTMRCEKSGSTWLRGRQTFLSADLCHMELPLWDAGIPLPDVRNGSHVQVRGFPENCDIRITSTSSGRHVIIPLNPFLVLGQQLDSGCEDSDTLHLSIKLAASQQCASEEDLKDYFHAVVLDVFAKKDIICSRSSKRQGDPVLRLRDKHNAVILLSEHTEAILWQALEQQRSQQQQRHSSAGPY